MADLTPKQETFCQEYLKDLNAKQAAIRTGYSERTAEVQGSRLLSNAKVKARVQELMDQRSERTQIDADYVLTTIFETVERCRQRVHPMSYKNGDPIYTETEEGEEARAYNFDSSAVLKGCELLGKHLKLFTDKIEHGGEVGIKHLPPDERQRRLRELEQELENARRD